MRPRQALIRRVNRTPNPCMPPARALASSASTRRWTWLARMLKWTTRKSSRWPPVATAARTGAGDRFAPQRRQPADDAEGDVQRRGGGDGWARSVSVRGLAPGPAGAGPPAAVTGRPTGLLQGQLDRLPDGTGSTYLDYGRDINTPPEDRKYAAKDRAPGDPRPARSLRSETRCPTRCSMPATAPPGEAPRVRRLARGPGGAQGPTRRAS